MRLVIFTSMVALYLAPGELHPLLAFTAILAIALGAAASAAINNWFDADIDAAMARTRLRPTASGRVDPADALTVGVTLAIISVMMMSLALNYLAGALLAFTIAFYVLVYTMWLKRRTPQNIVIGGAAGALPPVVAWAAAAGEVSSLPLLMFLVIFLWTPPHFWALALYRKGDYARVGVPMLPVVAGRRHTLDQILGYTVACSPRAWRRWRWDWPAWSTASLALGAGRRVPRARGAPLAAGPRRRRHAHLPLLDRSTCSCCSRAWWPIVSPMTCC